MASPALAAAADEPTTIAEVVVTAQKRTERAIDVPVSVTAVDAQALTSKNLVRVADYVTRVPSVTFLQAGNEQRANQLSIRGVSATIGTAATVAITVDDVPFTSSTKDAQAPLPDLDPAILSRVEVLRGPQGTLYGASSLGGLLKYVTAEPNAKTFSGRVEVGGSHADGGSNGFSLRGSVNIPIVQDRFALSLSGFDRQDPPYIDNINPAVNKTNSNFSEVRGGRIAAYVHPIDQLTIDLSAMRQHGEYDGSSLIQVCGAAGGPGTPGCTQRFVGQPSTTPRFGDFVTNLAPPNERETKFSLYSARVKADLGPVNLTTVSAYGDFQSASTVDQTRSFGFLLPFYSASGGSTPFLNADRTKKFTQEVRLESDRNEHVSWLLGGFYSHEDILVRQDISVSKAGGASAGMALAQDLPSTFVEKAVFGDLTFKLTPKFDVQVGARYGESDLKSRSVVTVDPLAEPVFGPSTADSNHIAEHSTTWLVTPRYRFSDDLMAYARFASGYRPGGVNAVLPGIPATFRSDTVVNYEVGLKGALRAYRVTFDISLFQINWDRIQLTATDVNTQVGYFTNGGTARSRGLEAQGEWRPLPGLTLSANLTWTDAVLTEAIPQPVGASTVIGAAGDRLPGAPHFAANFSIDKDWDIGNGFTAFAGVDYSYLGERPSDFNNILPPTTPGATNRAFGDRVKVPAYSLADLRGGVRNDDWSFTAYIRNITDKRGIVDLSTRGGTTTPAAVYIQPRTFGFVVARSF